MINNNFFKYLVPIIIIISGLLIFNFDNLKKIIPSEIKKFVREKIFIYQFLNTKISSLENEIIIKQKKKSQILYNIFSEGIVLKKNKEKEIQFKNLKENYLLHSWKLPFAKYGEFDRQQGFVIEKYKEKIYLINGDGDILYFNSDDIFNNQIEIFSVKSNFIDLINSHQFYFDHHLSVKDAFVDQEYLYLSYAKYVTNSCYNTSIIRGKLNSKNIIFENFFTPKECIDQKNHEHGGRIRNYDDQNLIMTVGAFGGFDEPQNENSIFGKIIMINKKSKKFKIISKGHRNPQGLIYNNKKKYIISTEHGPKGGDEVNLIRINQGKQIPNYGWPISSYGDHYDGKFKKEAPLKKSHKEFGFVEPIKYFTPSIAISELVDVTDIFGNGINTRIFVSALGYSDQSEEGDQSIHSLIFNENFEVLNEDRIFIGERIRDIYKIKSKNVIILSLESSPSIGVLESLN